MEKVEGWRTVDGSMFQNVFKALSHECAEEWKQLQNKVDTLGFYLPNYFEFEKKVLPDYWIRSVEVLQKLMNDFASKWGNKDISATNTE